MKKKGIVCAVLALLFVSLTSFTLMNRVQPKEQQEISSTNCDDDELIERGKRLHGYFCDDAPRIVVDIWYCPSSQSYYANMTYPEQIDHMRINRMKDDGRGNAYISYNGCSTYFFYINTSRW